MIYKPRYLAHFLCCITLLIWACSGSSGNAQQHIEKEGKEGGIDLETYQERLSQLPLDDPASSGTALQLFEKEFDKSNTSHNDLAFQTFNSFQGSLIEALNENDEWLMNLNPIAYPEGDQLNKAAAAYEKSLNEKGIAIVMMEGDAYAESYPSRVEATFLRHLSKPMKNYFELRSAEINQPLAEDGGLLLTVEELGTRLLQWDNFIMQNLQFPLLQECQENWASYLYFLMNGMDNSLAYDYSTKNWNPEFLKTYRTIVQNKPDSNTAKELKSFLDLLAIHDNQLTNEVQAYLESKMAY